MSDTTTLAGLLPAAKAENPIQARLERIAQTTADLTRMIKAQHDLLQRRPEFAQVLSLEPLHKLQAAYQDMTRLIDQVAQRPSGSQEILQLRALVRNAELINSTLELDFVLNDVVDTVVALTGAERGYILLKDATSGALAVRVARSARQDTLAPQDYTVSQSVVSQTAESGKIVVTKNAVGDQRFEEAESVFNLRLVSILCVPLVRKGMVTGVIYTDSRVRPELFDVNAQALVQSFANQAALAIENARLFEAVRLSLAEITTMRDLMANVFESIASGVITIDALGHVTTLNAAAAEILGITPGDHIGQMIGQLIPINADLLDRIAQQVNARQKEQSIDLDTSLPSRGPVNLSLRFSPLRGEPGASGAGVAIVLNDLTEARRHQAQRSVWIRYLPPALVDNIEVYERAQLGVVERPISVLSCDIRGFTSFSENLDPEKLMEIINIYLTISSDAIHASGGIIDKYMGDAVVGLFNTQINPQTDHAVLAVQAGLLMAREVQTQHSWMPTAHRLFFGIGVHSGSAVIGNLGSDTRKEFTAVGDTVQMAKLLQENAGKGEVLISQQTYDLVAAYFDVEPRTPKKKKDRADFTTLYHVIGVKAGVTLPIPVANGGQRQP